METTLQQQHQELLDKMDQLQQAQAAAAQRVVAEVQGLKDQIQILKGNNTGVDFSDVEARADAAIAAANSIAAPDAPAPAADASASSGS